MNQKKIIRIVLADDHPVVLEGLCALLNSTKDMRVVATATDGERLLEAIERFQPDVAGIDLQMPFMDGITCLRRIRQENLPVRVLIISAFGDVDTLRTAVEEGADGFVLKTASPEVTILAFRQVAIGQMVFPESIRRSFTSHYAFSPLTEREMQVLSLLAEGKSNAEIAVVLHLSENTVKYHLRNLFAKLGINNRTEAAAYYYRMRSAIPPKYGGKSSGHSE